METNNTKRHLISFYLLLIFTSYFFFPVYSDSQLFSLHDLPFTESSLFQMTYIGFQSFGYFSILPHFYMDGFDQLSNILMVNYFLIGTLFIPLFSLLALITNYFKKNLFHVFTFLLSFVMFFYALFLSILLAVEIPSSAYFIIVSYFILITIFIGLRDGVKHASAYACLIPVIGFIIAAIIGKRPKLLFWYLMFVVLFIAAGIIGSMKAAGEPYSNATILGIILIFFIGHFISYFTMMFSKKRIY